MAGSQQADMPDAFPHLFTPLQLAGRTLKNRIVFGAHTANMSHEGLPGDRHFGTARLMNLYTGDVEERQFDSLVLATTNDPEDRLSIELGRTRLDVHSVGDAVQARTAAMAIYEARKLAMTL